MKLHLPDEQATAALGRALALSRPAKACVHLHGELGAGKSSLARSLLRALGVTGPIRSPTYTLVERYPLADGEAWHLDLYRIGAPEELDFLGLDAEQTTLWLVEWPDRGRGFIPAADLQVSMSIEGSGRLVMLTAHSPAGDGWLTSTQGVFTP